MPWLSLRADVASPAAAASARTCGTHCVVNRMYCMLGLNRTHCASQCMQGLNRTKCAPECMLGSNRMYARSETPIQVNQPDNLWKENNNKKV